VESCGGAPHPPAGHRALRPGAGRPIFDALTFPLSSGDEGPCATTAMHTIEGDPRIKAEHPACTPRSASQRRFGLTAPRPPRPQHGVPAQAVEAGLDSAIVHAAASCRLNKIPRTHSRCASTGLRPPLRGLRPARPLLDVIADVTVPSREGGPQRLAGPTELKPASSTATATGSPPTSTRRWPRAPPRSTSSTTPCCRG
jgi:hypothetical protein